VASPVVSPPDAPVVSPVIFSDVPVVPPADVLVGHPHVVALISGLEATSSMVMENLFATHMSFIHEGIHTSSFMEGEVHSASKIDGVESDSFNFRKF